MEKLPENVIALGPDNYYTKGVIDGEWVGV
jgi:hypothetical protein